MPAMRMKSEARVRKQAKVDGKRNRAAGGQPDRHADHLLLGDVGLVVPLGEHLLEPSLNVEFLMSASSATTRASTLPSFASAVP